MDEKYYWSREPNDDEVNSLIELAQRKKSKLLLEYLARYIRNDFLQNEFGFEMSQWESPRSFDVAIGSEYDPLVGKIRRHEHQLEKMGHGDCQQIVILVPAYNEEKSLPLLLDSIQRQVVDDPVTVIVSDNGSSDSTLPISIERGANVVCSGVPGCCPTRRAGLDYLMRTELFSRPQDTIIIQIDADSELLGEGFLASVSKHYKDNPDCLISVGPSEYIIGTSIIDTGKAYRKFFGKPTLGERLMALGYDPEGIFGKGEKHPKLLIGGNTVYRGTIFRNRKNLYPNKNIWEAYYMSIALQQDVPPSRITFLPEQRVRQSTRGVVLKDGMYHIPPYKTSMLGEDQTILYAMRMLGISQ